MDSPINSMVGGERMMTCLEGKFPPNDLTY